MLKTFFLIILSILCLSAAYAGISAAPWVRTIKRDRKRLSSLLEIQPGQKFYDLGCGDGIILDLAADKKAICYGYELSLIPYFLAHIRRFFSKNKESIHLLYQDFWKANLSEADIVYMFLMKKSLQKIKPKLEKELKKDTIVISHVWPIEGWIPYKVDKYGKGINIYCYKVKK